MTGSGAFLGVFFSPISTFNFYILKLSFLIFGKTMQRSIYALAVLVLCVNIPWH